jgi:hypothetical protein
VVHHHQEVEIREVAPDRIIDPVAARIAAEQDDLEAWRVETAAANDSVRISTARSSSRRLPTGRFFLAFFIWTSLTDARSNGKG